MALNITFCNKFSAQSNPPVLMEVGISENDPNPDELNPGDCLPTESLDTNGNKFIWAKKSTALENCEIRLRATEGDPKIKIQLTGSKWKFENIGTNTGTTVEAGPDGQ